MRFFIDTEFNSMGGALLSIALVPEDDGPEFYEVIAFNGVLHPWGGGTRSADHGKAAIPYEQVQKRLAVYLMAHHKIEVVAEWPDDIKYFCELLITGPGQRIATPPLQLWVIDIPGGYESAIPHNALEDARAIKQVLAFA